MPEVLGMIIHDMPEVEYHARPELSSHDARALLESPMKFRYAKDNNVREDKPEFDLGTAVHSKVLGVGAQAVAYPPDKLASNGAASTNEAKAWAEEQRQAGRVPVKAATLETINAAAEAVLAFPDARALLEVPGHAEATLIATDPDTGVDVRCRFDFLPNGPERRIVDLKTATSAQPAAFAASAVRIGYHIQRSFYLDALRFELPAEGRSAEVAFVVVELEPPYMVAVHYFDLTACEMGDVEARRARELYAACVATNTWPRWVGDDGGPTDLTAPMWSIYEFQDKYGEIGQ